MEGQFQCEVCNQGFVTNQEYNNHVGAKHRASTHVCSVCGRSCYDKAALQGHMARHAKDYGKNQNIRCELCNKTFLQEKYLKHHFLRMHKNGGQRFVCDHCGKKLANYIHVYFLPVHTYATDRDK
ncbi:hypothetical protein NQ318_020902 [Aromia moschata]|uniref:C2H2-type domain-containing protein n=1 Tax=Aromia moschata TaxID=1265417 RepID=A0AAV8XXJ9_9CUCU|nr:hypothetical protein NQ318_020902 [Aromia moschata]